MKNTIILLIGYPGSGKLTIAKELVKKITNSVIVDNHSTNNVIFPFLDLSKNLKGNKAWEYIRKIRNIQADFLIEEFDINRNIIFTLYLTESESDKINALNRVLNIVEKRKAIFIPIKLECNLKEIEKRISSDERKLKHKLTDINTLKKIINSGEPLLNINEFKNNFTIDNSNFSIDETVDKIIGHINNIK